MTMWLVKERKTTEFEAEYAVEMPAGLGAGDVWSYVQISLEGFPQPDAVVEYLVDYNLVSRTVEIPPFVTKTGPVQQVTVRVSWKFQG